MSKKHKNRHKKQQIAKVIQESMGTSEVEEIVVEPKGKDEAEKFTSKATGKSVPEQKNSLLPEVARVKRDIKKIGLVIGSIIVCLVIATILDTKTGWVLKLSDYVIKVMPN